MTGRWRPRGPASPRPGARRRGTGRGKRTANQTNDTNQARKGGDENGLRMATQTQYREIGVPDTDSRFPPVSVPFV
jgi:hypothetical protein